jgi:hypothetical protein
MTTLERCTTTALGVVAALGILGLALRAEAQSAGPLTFTLDAGTASIRYDSAPGWSAATLTPALRVERTRFALGASGTVALLDGLGWSSQGSVDGALMIPIAPAVQAELASLAEGGRHEGLYQSTGQALGEARLHWLTHSRGAWIGGGVGRAWNAESRPVLAIGGAGAWVRLGGVTLTASVSRRQFDDEYAVTRDTTLITQNPDTSQGIRYDTAQALLTDRVSARRNPTDAAAQLHWVRGLVELDVSFGRRFERGTSGDGVWGGASGVVWLSRQLALVASAGSYPGDFAQRLPRSRYATLAVRLVPWGPIRTATPTPRTGGISFEVRDAGAGMHTLVMRAPHARQVEIMGDFTDWQPLPLARGRDGEWTVTLPLATGTHRLNVRVDGGDWSAPPGLTAAADEFLGVVGILIVQ